MNRLKTITFSEIKTFLTCQQRWKFRYIDLLTPETKSQAMLMGSYVHDQLATYYAGAGITEVGCDENLEESNRQFSYIMVDAVIDAGKLKQFDVDPEKEFMVDIPGRRTKFTGKIDGIVLDHNGRNILIEHKTTGNTFDKLIKVLSESWQCKLYLWAISRLTDIPTWESCYQIIEKPSRLRLKKNETESELLIRKAQWYRDTEHIHLFYKPMILSEIKAVPAFLYTIVGQMLNALNQGVTKNCEECESMIYKEGCPFLSVCQGGNTDHFEIRETKHQELRGYNVG